MWQKGNKSGSNGYSGYGGQRVRSPMSPRVVLQGKGVMSPMSPRGAVPNMAAKRQGAATWEPSTAKRQHTSGPGCSKGIGKAPPQDAIIVAVEGPEAQEITVKTLIGEYTEKGVNHGRKVYQKQGPGTEQVEVLLYYWDSRDGPSFEGWWFGNKLGGTQVWSHCKDSGVLPPRKGWKVPWDGSVREGITVTRKSDAQQEQQASRLKEFEEELARMDGEVTGVLEKVSSMVSKNIVDASEEQLTEAETALAPHIAPVDALARKVQLARDLGQGASAGQYHGLCERARQMQSTLRGRSLEVRSTRDNAAKAKADTEQLQQDQMLLGDITTGGVERTNKAEDLVEKTEIMAELITGVDDIAIIKTAVKDTEDLAKLAQAAIGESRIFLNTKVALTRRMSDSMRNRTQVEVQRLLTLLGTLQAKLNPFKAIRRDYEQQENSKRVLKQVHDKLALAEVDVDRAELATRELLAAEVTKENLAQTQQLVTAAEQSLSQASRLLDNNRNNSSLVADEIAALVKRKEDAQSRLLGLRNDLKEATERTTLDAYTSEAEQKLLAVTEAMSKVESMAAKLQTDDPPAEELARAELAEKAAHTVASMARMFLQMKNLEVRRYVSKAGKEALERFGAGQQKIEEVTKRLEEFKERVSALKRGAILRELEKEVVLTEAHVAKVQAAASVFSDEARLASLSPADFQRAGDEMQRAEKEATHALSEARKKVTARQVEAKRLQGAEHLAQELVKFQGRIHTVQQEIAKQRKIYSSVTQQQELKKVIEQAEERLKAAVEKVDLACDKIRALEADPAAPSKEADVSAQDANVAVRTLSRWLEAQTVDKEELKDMMQRVNEVQTKLTKATGAKRERQEAIVLRDIQVEGERKIRDGEAAVRLMADAEFPLQGVVPTIDGIHAFERTIQAAQAKIADGRTFISMKKLAVRGLSQDGAQSLTDTLTGFSARVDGLMEQISDARWRCVELKKTLPRAPPKAQAKAHIRDFGFESPHATAQNFEAPKRVELPRPLDARELSRAVAPDLPRPKEARAPTKAPARAPAAPARVVLPKPVRPKATLPKAPVQLGEEGLGCPKGGFARPKPMAKVAAAPLFKGGFVDEADFRG